MNLFKRSTIATLLVMSLVACGDSRDKKIAYYAQVQHIIDATATQKKTSLQLLKGTSAKGEQGVKEAQTIITQIIQNLENDLKHLEDLDVPKEGKELHQASKDIYTTGIKSYREDLNALNKGGFEGLFKQIQTNQQDQQKITNEQNLAKSLEKASETFIQTLEITEEDLAKAKKKITK